MAEIMIAKALEQLGGSGKLYKKLVTGFVDKYTRVDKDLKYLLLDKELDDARRLAHTMKGLGGNLGAQNFHEKAKKLETAIKNLIETDDPDELTRILTMEWRMFSKELNDVLYELDKILYADDHELEQFKTSKELQASAVYYAPDQEEPVVLSKLSRDSLASVIRCLKSYNYENVMNAVEHMDYSVFDKVCPKCKERFQDALQEYEYDEAVLILEGVLND